MNDNGCNRACGRDWLMSPKGGSEYSVRRVGQLDERYNCYYMTIRKRRRLPRMAVVGASVTTLLLLVGCGIFAPVDPDAAPTD